MLVSMLFKNRPNFSPNGTGAGKTTTFSMLTGDLGITDGTTFLDGFNIQTNLKEVCCRIYRITHFYSYHFFDILGIQIKYYAGKLR